MSIPTVYIPHLTDSDHIVDIHSTDEIKHIRAHRMQIGDQLRVTNGKGISKLAILNKIEKNVANFQIIRSLDSNEPIFQRILLLANISQESLETAYSNSISLGIHQFYLFRAAYSQTDKVRLDRLYRIGIATIKQCGRSVIPEIIQVENLIIGIETIFRKFNENFSFFYCDVNGSNFLDYAKTLQTKSGIIFAIGPEGGFSEEEKKIFAKHLILPLSLGKRILRSELAATAALSLLCNFP